MTDNGTLPDEIQGDGIFTANTSITAAKSGHPNRSPMRRSTKPARSPTARQRTTKHGSQRVIPRRRRRSLWRIS
jgi:hypothetical protein